MTTTTTPLPAGLETAIAAMQALRERQAARRAAFPAKADQPPPAPIPAPAARRGHGTPGQGRFARPVPVRDAINAWWIWD